MNSQNMLSKGKASKNFVDIVEWYLPHTITLSVQQDHPQIWLPSGGTLKHMNSNNFYSFK